MIPEPNEGDKLATRIWLESYSIFLPMGDVAKLLRVLHHTETELAKLRERVRELEAELDPPICRLQFPDGSVPGNAREAAEGWKQWYDKKEIAQ